MRTLDNLVVSVRSTGRNAREHEMIKLSAILYDPFFTEEKGRFSAYARPTSPDVFEEEALCRAGLQGRSRDALFVELNGRLPFWDDLPTVWSSFLYFLMRHVDAQGGSPWPHVRWMGLRPLEEVAIVSRSLERHNLAMNTEIMGTFTSLIDVIIAYELVLSYLGMPGKIGHSLEEIADFFKLRRKGNLSSLDECELIARCMQKHLATQKRLHETAFGMGRSK